MQYRKLGRTQIDVSVVAFGAWAIAGGANWGPQDENDSREALQAAYDAGVTLFDTAEAYGNGKSEELIGEALHTVRDRIVIATKVAPRHFAPEEIKASCERSLQALRTDRIDLYQLHWPRPDMSVEDIFATLEELKAAGKIRAYGVSNFGTGTLGHCLERGDAIESNQVCYNLLFRAVEHAILPLCRTSSISVLCYSPLMQGLLCGKFNNADAVPEERARTRHFSSSRPKVRHTEAGAEQLTFETIRRIDTIAKETGHSMAVIAMAWLLAQEGVTSVLAGARNKEQARSNAAVGDVVLSGDLIRRLSEATADLKERLGPNADPWQSDSRTV